MLRFFVLCFGYSFCSKSTCGKKSERIFVFSSFPPLKEFIFCLTDRQQTMYTYTYTLIHRMGCPCPLYPLPNYLFPHSFLNPTETTPSSFLLLKKSAFLAGWMLPGFISLTCPSVAIFFLFFPKFPFFAARPIYDSAGRDQATAAATPPPPAGTPAIILTTAVLPINQLYLVMLPFLYPAAAISLVHTHTYIYSRTHLACIKRSTVIALFH